MVQHIHSSERFFVSTKRLLAFARLRKPKKGPGRAFFSSAIDTLQDCLEKRRYYFQLSDCEKFVYLCGCMRHRKCYHFPLCTELLFSHEKDPLAGVASAILSFNGTSRQLLSLVDCMKQNANTAACYRIMSAIDNASGRRRTAALAHIRKLLLGNDLPEALRLICEAAIDKE